MRLETAGRAVAVTAVLALSGCGGPVTLSETGVAPDAAEACRDLVAALPSTLSDQQQVESTGAPGAAYEDGVTVRCGVAEPETLDQFSTCQTVNGVDWYVPEEAIEDQGADVVATTISRTPRVELVIPGSLRPPAAAFAQLAEPVASSTSTNGPSCR